MIGLINAILVIKFINVANDPLVAVPVSSAVAIGFAILIVPLLDTLRVFSIRILNGQSPFTPDRNHVHHLLLDRGMDHAAVTLTCVTVNIAFIVLAWFGRGLGPNYLMLLMLALAFSGLAVLYYYKRPKRAVLIAKRGEAVTAIQTSATKVVTLTKEKEAQSAAD
jgi:UDP-N-acetylmuramyl pentapeptide phosphotransferase/UDP-N-acetylglucosamine-1-phosphate transferase